MDKVAMIESIYEEALRDELEKLGFNLGSLNPKKIISALKGSPKATTPGARNMMEKATPNIDTVKQMQDRIKSIRAATAAGRSVI